MLTITVSLLVASTKVTKLNDSKSLKLPEYKIFDTYKQIQQRHTNTNFQTQIRTTLLKFKIFPLLLFTMMAFLLNSKQNFMKHEVSKQFKISSVHISPVTQSATTNVNPAMQ
jgi:hypothetical protein